MIKYQVNTIFAGVSFIEHFIGKLMSSYRKTREELDAERIIKRITSDNSKQCLHTKILEHTK